MGGAPKEASRSPEDASAHLPTCFGVGQEALQPGVRVRLRGLVQLPNLNGAIGVIDTWDEQSGRWVVSLDGGDVRWAKPDNIELLAPAAEHLEVTKAAAPETMGCSVVADA